MFPRRLCAKSLTAMGTSLFSMSINVKTSSEKVSVVKVALAFIAAAIVPTIMLQHLLMLMYVPSESMYPTMTAGNVLIGTRIASVYHRGDIVVFQSDVLIIKRVVGLPEENVTIDEFGQVYINEAPLSEPYVVQQREGQPQSFTVPEGCLLLFGDNRQHSYDARYWKNPYVNQDDVIAVAKFKLWDGFTKL